jgi:hypothetical protein
LLRECAKAFSGFQIKTVHGMAKKVPTKNQEVIRNSFVFNTLKMRVKIFPGTFHPKQVKSRSGSLKLVILAHLFGGRERATRAVDDLPQGIFTRVVTLCSAKAITL